MQSHTMLCWLQYIIMSQFPSLEFDNKTIAILKSQIEEEFKRTYGKPYDWKNILKNNSVKKVVDDLRLTFTIANDLTRFRLAIENMLKYSDKYQFIIENDRELERERISIKIKRINKYQGVNDYRSLIQLVEKYPGGLFVDEELTNFTFREAKAEIERAIGEKRLKRIYKQNTKDEYFYIFPRSYETEYEIRQDTFKYFTMNDYLDLCTHLNSVQEETVNVAESRERTAKESNADPNYQLPGYLELKEKWQKKHAVKK